MASAEIGIDEGYKKACFLLGDALTRLALTEEYMPKEASDFYEPQHLHIAEPELTPDFEEMIRTMNG